MGGMEGGSSEPPEPPLGPPLIIVKTNPTCDPLKHMPVTVVYNIIFLSIFLNINYSPYSSSKL